MAVPKDVRFNIEILDHIHQPQFYLIAILLLRFLAFDISM